jgi:hypothetical protein
MALNICPEAVQSGKRVKMIHKKGELELAGDLKLKWNVDYKGGHVASLRVVTLKAKGGEELPEGGGESAAEGEIKAVESAAGDAAATAGRKRPRREMKPENIDVKKYILLAVEGLRFKGKEAEAEQLTKLAEEL